MTTTHEIPFKPLCDVKLRVVFPRGWSFRLRLSAQIIRLAAFVAGVEAKVEISGSEPQA